MRFFAQAIAFNAIFAVFPLAILTIAAFAFVYGNATGEARALALIKTLAPALQQTLVDNLQHIVQFRGVSGAIAIGALLWSGKNLFQGLAYALNRALDIPTGRPLVRDILVALVILPVLGALFIIATFVPIVITVAAQHGGFGDAPFIAQLAGYASGVLLIFVVAAVLYVYLPNRRMNIWFGIPGAIVFTTAWEIAQVAFAIYTSHVDYRLVYGALGAFALLLIWFYYMAAIFLFGAQVSAQWADRKMKRLFRSWLVLLGFALPLVGAAESPYPPPIVVVYPITAAGGTSPEAGSQIALLLSARLASLGGLVVKPFTPGTTRTDFLNAALQQNADYYVTGYLAPVGNDVSFVAQVVSTHSGSIVFSSTQLVHTYGDAAGQADSLHDAILHHAGRGLAALEAAPPQPSVSQPPSKGGSGINIFKAFSHKGAQAAPGSSPAARPSSALAQVAPAGTTAIVVTTDGNGDDADRTYAASALSAALDKSGLHSSVVALDVADVTAHASDLCRRNPGVATFYAGTLGLGRLRHHGTSVAFDLTAYDCNAAPLGHEHVELPADGGGVRSTIDRATGEAVQGLHLASRATGSAPSVSPASPRATS